MRQPSNDFPKAAPSSAHTVGFSGDGRGTYPLTWSQKWLWRGIALTAPDIERMNMGRVIPVPPGLSSHAVLDAVAMLMSRHTTLRTRFHIDDHGVPRQAVVGCGELLVEAYGAAREECSDVARAVLDRACAAPFTAPEFSARVALVMDGREPAMLVLCVFHMATDAWGMRIIVDDLRAVMEALVAGDDRPPPDRPAQLLERLDFEQSPQGARRSAQAIDYWEQQIPLFPRRACPPPIHRPDVLPFRDLHMESAALSVACRALAQTLRVGVGAVFIGLAAVLLSAEAGNPGSGFLVFSHNRHGRKWSDLSGPLIQNFPLHVNVAGRAFPDIVRDIDGTSVLGSFRGQYDPDELGPVLAKSADIRGFAPDLSCAVNAKLGRDPGPRGPDLRTAPAVASRDVMSLLAGSRVIEGAGVHREDMNFYLSVDCRPSRTEVLLRANTAMFQVARMRSFLTDLEGMAVRDLPQV
ncbi:condensation domain-containing protein [Streptomyces canus]|uniref:condensation domain-containing protein n=1 Tax=Streptomyces canus TaxID=58343 RepID=UPI003404B1C0